MNRLKRWVATAFLAGAVLGVGLAALIRATPGAAAPAESALAVLKEKFRRPAKIPFPDNNPFSEPKRALGEKLFNDRRLSIDNTL